MAELWNHVGVYRVQYLHGGDSLLYVPGQEVEPKDQEEQEMIQLCAIHLALVSSPRLSSINGGSR